MNRETELLKKMHQGEFVVSVQIDPPTDLEAVDFLRKTAHLRKMGVNVVDINSRTAQSHESIGIAAVLAREGFEVVPHITSRPSSISGLLDQVRTGYAFFGVRNYLVVTGDRFRNVEGIGVFEKDSVGIIAALSNHFREQNSVGDIAFAAAINQNNNDPDLEGERVEAKCEAGADFFMSQPVFDQDQVKSLVSFNRQHTINPLLVGIWPLIYPSMIEKVRTGKVDGVVIPDEIYHQSITHVDKLREWGLVQAGYLIEDLKNYPDVAGVYIVAPARNPLHLTDLLERVLS